MAGLWSDAKFTVDNVPLNEFDATHATGSSLGPTLDLTLEGTDTPSKSDEEGKKSDKTGLSKDVEERTKELMPPFYKTQGDVDEETLKWDAKHKQAKREIRQTKEYQFAMFVAGASGQRLDRIWMSPSEEPANTGRAPVSESGDSFLTAAPESDAYSRMQQFQHKWAMVPEISLEINLSPSTFFHLEEAMATLQREKGCEYAKAEIIISQRKTSMLLASLVALGMNMSSFMGGMNYQLDSNYMRLKKEKRIAVWRLAAECRRSFNV